MQVAITRSPSSGRPVWPASQETFPPSSAAASSSTPALRAVMRTLAPASAKALAMPLPMPLVPPVTMAALPSSRGSMAGRYSGRSAADEVPDGGGHAGQRTGQQRRGGGARHVGVRGGGKERLHGLEQLTQLLPPLRVGAGRQRREI